MTSLFITSGNRKDGKTFVSAGFATTMQSLGYSTSVFKPIQTRGIDINGFTQSPDLTFIKTMDPYINTHFSYIFKSNKEPLISAELDNKQIDLDLIVNDYSRILNSSDCTIIDGECGILSPIAPSIQTIDIVKKMQVPLLIITKPNEESINNVLMTINTAQEKGILVRGVILNNITENCPKATLTNITRIIEEYSNVNILGLIPNLGEKFKPEDLISGILNGVDIESVFNVKIEKLELNQ